MDTGNNGIASSYVDPSSTAMDTDIIGSSERVPSIGARIQTLKEMLGQVRQDLFDEPSNSALPASQPRRTLNASFSYISHRLTCSYPSRSWCRLKGVAQLDTFVVHRAELLVANHCMYSEANPLLSLCAACLQFMLTERRVSHQQQQSLRRLFFLCALISLPTRPGCPLATQEYYRL